MYYIYTHSNKEYGTFYVGKGSGERLKTTGNRSEYWKRIVAKYGYEASILENGLTEKEAYAREIYWIRHFKTVGQCRANFTNGGDGVQVEKRWWGQKISNSLKGKKGARGEASGAFKRLPVDLIIKLYTEDGKGIVEIAGLVGCSYTTVSTRLAQHNIERRGSFTRRRPIICTQSGHEFESITAAAEATGLYRENIRKVLAGKYRHTGGMHFKYKEVET